MRVCFDVGNVLCDCNLTAPPCLRQMEDLYWEHLKFIQVDQDLGKNGFYDFLQYSPIPAVREKMERSLQICSTDKLRKVVTDHWNAGVTLNPLMANLISHLKFDGFKIAILSNMGFDHMESLTERYPEVFKDTVHHFSCEVGARKPQKTYFQSFLMDHAEFTGAPFIDDRWENLEVAGKYGFNIYHFSLEDLAAKSQLDQKKEVDKLKYFIENGVALKQNQLKTS